jgi:hypothetical protein
MLNEKSVTLIKGPLSTSASAVCMSVWTILIATVLERHPVPDRRLVSRSAECSAHREEKNKLAHSSSLKASHPVVDSRVVFKVHRAFYFTPETNQNKLATTRCIL